MDMRPSAHWTHKLHAQTCIDMVLFSNTLHLAVQRGAPRQEQIATGDWFMLCMSIYSTELGPCWEPSMGPDMKA